MEPFLVWIICSIIAIILNIWHMKTAINDREIDDFKIWFMLAVICLSPISIVFLIVYLIIIIVVLLSQGLEEFGERLIQKQKRKNERKN
jgi:hypothetical protein